MVELGREPYTVEVIKIRFIATRWSVHDVIGRLETEYEGSDRAKFIVIPALDENDESNFDYYGDSRTVDVHVKRLREKLEGVSDQWSIKTVWSVGYKFELKQS